MVHGDDDTYLFIEFKNGYLQDRILKFICRWIPQVFMTLFDTSFYS